MRSTYRTIQLVLGAAGALLIGGAVAATINTPRIIDVTADSDNRFKVAKQKEPIITMKVNEVALLCVNARKGGEWDEKDGAVHTFTINALRIAAGISVSRKAPTKFTVVAPSEPGEYTVECTVKCGKGHDDMKMKLVVTQ